MDSRAQLNIMEVLVCIGLLLLAFIGMVSAIEVTEKEAFTTDTNILREIAHNALVGADETGLLRPAIYEAPPGLPLDSRLEDLETYLDAVLPLTTLYTIKKLDLNSSVLTTLEIGNYAFSPTALSDTGVAKYLVTGHLTYSDPYLVILYVWRL
ncbi:MAG: hypothetical protein ACFFBD_00035 [Candidatus Hodarchaeota archaeon]